MALASLLDLAATGKLGAIAIGMSLESLLDCVGEPCWCDSDNIRDPRGYWRVGNAEFFFEDGRLHHGWCQEAELDDLGPNMMVESSGITYGMSPEDLHTVLASKNVGWREIPCEDGEYEYMIETSAGVQFFFHRIDDEVTGGDGLKMWVFPAPT